MIHSLAGGSFREKKILDFCKIELTESLNTGKVFWYTTGGLNLTAGDEVLVPLGKNNLKVRGKVLRVDKNVVEGQTPVPINMAKEVIRKL